MASVAASSMTTSVDLQQEQDGCLPGSRDAGEDVSGHGNSSHADHVDGMARWGSSRMSGGDE